MTKKHILAISLAAAVVTLANFSSASEISANINSSSTNSKDTPDTRIFDRQGNIKYLIGFKPIDKITEDANENKKNNIIAQLSEKFDDPIDINEEILSYARDKKLYAPKDSLASLLYLRDQYGIEAELVLTHIDKVVSVYLTNEQAKKIAEDEVIQWILPDEKMSMSAFDDYDNNLQFSTWGLSATNSSNTGGSGYAYVADTELTNEILPDWPTVTRIHSNQSYFIPSDSFHPVYVIGIAAGRNNNQNARGVFQGNIIHTSILDVSVGFAASAIETAYLDAEAKGKFAAINLSTNASAYSDQTTNINKWVSIVSNRLLVVQSAGNQNEDACFYAYNPRGSNQANPIDGIMVVGAYDKNGKRATTWPDGWSGAGSNYGSCVDIWAPGKDIAVSTRLDAPYFKNYPETTLGNVDYYKHDTIGTRGYIMAAGGTSFAAPFVTGIAASLGNSNTIRPPQLESMLRNTAVSRGIDDMTGSTIKSVYYNSNAVASGLKYNSSSYSSSLPSALRDGKYETMAWNAGGFSGGFNFGAVNLKAVRFTPHAPGEDGTLNYSITSVNISGATITVASGSVTSYNHAPITVSIPDQFSGLLSYTINFSRPNAWVALTEFELYTQ